MKIVTIARNPENSPNMTTNDAAILERITEELRRMGAVVSAIDATEDIPEDADIVCHMSRTPEVLKKLKETERAGIKVINSPEAVENCSRIEFMRILEKNGIPQPQFHVVEKTENFNSLRFPAWIKRGNGWSCHKDDVSYVTNSEEAMNVIGSMMQRGVDSFIHSSHCEGDIIKFYGVKNSFFTYCYPVADSTKFGLEKINGEAKHYHFSIDTMRDIVTKAANAVGLDIYGGDCIVNNNGDIQLIDLNDFPSFSSVRDEAAKKIAEFIMNSK